MSRRRLLAQRVEYCGTAVDGDDDYDVCGQVETEQLDVLYQLTDPVSCVPLDREFPDDVGDVAEERDDEVGRGEVPDQQLCTPCMYMYVQCTPCM